MCLALEYARGDIHTYMKFEDKGEDRKRTTELRVYLHQQTAYHSSVVAMCRQRP